MAPNFGAHFRAGLRMNPSLTAQAPVDYAYAKAEPDFPASLKRETHGREVDGNAYREHG